LVNEISLYYDARSEKHQIAQSVLLYLVNVRNKMLDSWEMFGKQQRI